MESPAHPLQVALLLHEVSAFPQRSMGRWLLVSFSPASPELLAGNLLITAAHIPACSHQGRAHCHLLHYHCTLPVSRSPPVLSWSTS